MEKDNSSDENIDPSSEGQVDENEAESSAAESSTGGREATTLEDVVTQAAEGSQPPEGETETEGVEDAASSDPTIGTDGGEGAEGSGSPRPAGEPGKAGAKGAEGTEEPPPFHEHPRWKEMVAERDKLREQTQSYEQEKPFAETQRALVAYCNTNGITEQQFQAMLELAAIANSNPTEAVKRLDDWKKQLSEFDETSLSPDLEEAVAREDEALPLKYAHEIARLRAQLKGGTVRSRRTEEEVMRERQAANLEALASWERNIAKTDVDFHPKRNANDPDGRYEFTIDVFRGLVAANPPQTRQQVLQLVQQAYERVSRTFNTRLRPRTPMGKRMPQSAGKTMNREPKSLEEAVEAAAARHSGD